MWTLSSGIRRTEAEVSTRYTRRNWCCAGREPLLFVRDRRVTSIFYRLRTNRGPRVHEASFSQDASDSLVVRKKTNEFSIWLVRSRVFGSLTLHWNALIASLSFLSESEGINLNCHLSHRYAAESNDSDHVPHRLIQFPFCSRFLHAQARRYTKL